MSRVAAWIADTRRLYFDNASATRDLRVQMRGYRSALLFGVYLFLLIGVALLIYSQAVSSGPRMMVDAQAQLRQFFNTMMVTLGGVVALVAPALTATTIAIERQRRSLDLIFSAPVEPRYYLVGKLVASFRYTWMLLVLSLPVSAMCVLLGGATWSDVLLTYLTLSMHGLAFTAMALVASSIATKPVGAVMLSYAAATMYIVLSLPLTTWSYFTSNTLGSLEAPFYAALNPFAVYAGINTHTTIAGIEVPNWIFACTIALIAAKVCLLGAAIQLSPTPRKEIGTLRIHSLIWSSAISLYFGYWSLDRGIDPGTIAMIVSLPLLIAMPFLSTYGFDAERRYRPNGLFRFRHILDGTAAGSLPFLATFLTGNAVAAYAGRFWASQNNVVAGPAFAGVNFASIAYLLSFWFFFWSVGRVASAFSASVRTARIVQFAVVVALLVIPLPIIMLLDMMRFEPFGMSAWSLYMLFIFSSATSVAPLLTATLAAITAASATGLTAVAEFQLGRRLTPEAREVERVLASS